MYLIGNLFLVFFGKVDEMVILGTDKKRDRRFIEAPTLPIPLLDRVQRTFSCKIEHEEDRYCIVTHQRKHIDKLALTSEVPN